jgi:hypothetical protein
MTKEKKMLISDLIKELELIKTEHGDIPCVHSEEHEYWGSVQAHLSRHYNVEVGSAQPDGPKSGKSELCVKFGK